jgi:predicted transcriptional regulator
MQTVVDEEVHSALKVLAAKTNYTLGELIELAIKEYLVKEDNKFIPQGEHSGSVGE